MPYTSQNTKFRKRVTLLDASENADAALYLTDLDTPPPAPSPTVNVAVAFGANGRILQWNGLGFDDWNLGIGIHKEVDFVNGTVTPAGDVSLTVDFSPYVLPAELVCMVTGETTVGTGTNNGFIWAKTGASEITLVGDAPALTTIRAHVVAY